MQIHHISQPTTGLSKRKKTRSGSTNNDNVFSSIFSVMTHKRMYCFAGVALTIWFGINIFFLQTSLSDKPLKLKTTKYVTRTPPKKIVKEKKSTGAATPPVVVDDDEPSLLIPPRSDDDDLDDDLPTASVLYDLFSYEDDDFFFTPDQQKSQIRLVSIQAVLDPHTNSSALKDPLTPQYKAFQWLLFQDTRQIHPDDPHVIQRFALAVLFYALNGPNWHHGDLHFLSAVHECHWKKSYKKRMLGVMECNEKNYITRIELAENNLQGTLPPEIGLLSELQSLDLQNNRLKGTIPTHLSQLANLQQLTLNTNNFSGSIPSEIGSLTKLEEMMLQFNEFSGAVPQSICMLKTKGELWNLWTDCASSLPALYCGCCEVCCNGLVACAPP